ncbi:segregation/condensation protein A [Enterococcus italicus]|uniref:Segregation and condensation protein A n=1 Tax=Enterococcus italicus (strain DSM 15952 / CCUG 50447 / LMG 22039 / TP 1.5) TaxID=888064 RepID=E6LF83_ENTI1|nr:segregation/condensation protein A [Enterococcus italicus]EFU74110.1 ScpA/B protein [Enterococcus italicus DSM 15952]OJG59273.1 segregation and condensation protein A [Enterococcus italicus DSM 15952]
MKEMNLKLAVFEGPLDLLLHLIQQYELDIYDIPISEITEQYMSYIHAMKDLQLEVAGEYLVMAATLMSIKSQMLLPTMEEEEEFFDDFFEEDPRDLLVAQLVEYKKYKAAAHQLSDYADQRQLFFSKEPLDMDEYKEVNQELPDNQVNTIDLFLAFHQLLEKRKKRAKFEASISNDKVTIEECIKTIETRVHLLTDKQGCPFDSLFDTGSKEEIVTTFMALLELLKYKKIKVVQENSYEQIMIFAGEGTNEVLL